MAVIRFFIFGFLALAVSGCLQTVSESLAVPEKQASVACPKTIVVLPFAEYFNSSGTAYNKNKLVTETIVDRLVVKGFNVPVQEDVLQYLLDKKIISRVAANTEGRKVLMDNVEKELTWGWSDEMNNRLRELVAEERNHDFLLADAEDSSLEMPGMYGLDEKSVKEIGERFGADYLLRGRIIEYSGSSGQKPQAKVMLRMWVQDAGNGKVVWTNRSEATVSSESTFANTKTEDLLEQAVNKAVTKLVDDFCAKTLL